MENYRWVWPYWLARGKLHLLAGPPGVAKTTLALSMAATISSGKKKEWPDGTKVLHGNVLIWSGEDAIADTLMPRLIGMGADPECIHIISAVDEEGRARHFDPASDIQKLGPAFEGNTNQFLFMLDPLSNAIIGDSYKSTEVRRGLQPLVDLIEHRDIL